MRRSGLADRATPGVLAVDQPVRSAGVDHQQGQAVRGQVERQVADRAVASVVQQGVPVRGAQRGGLVHPAGHRTGDLVLRADAGLREPGSPLVGGGEAHTERLVECHGYGALQRRGGRQPGAVRDARVHRSVEPAQGGPVVRHGPGDPRRVAGPAGHGPGADVRERHRPRAVLLLGGDQPHLAVRGAAEGYVGAVRQGDRQAQAAVVVGVLADQVDPAGRRPHAVRLGVELGTELLGGAAGALGRVPREDPFGGHASSRRRAAICSGAVSEIQAAIPDSTPARYLSLVGARRTEIS